MSFGLKLGFSRQVLQRLGGGAFSAAAGQSPAAHEGVDGVNKHQQGEQSQSHVHLAATKTAETGSNPTGTLVGLDWGTGVRT